MTENLIHKNIIGFEILICYLFFTKVKNNYRAVMKNKHVAKNRLGIVSQDGYNLIVNS